MANVGRRLPLDGRRCQRQLKLVIVIAIVLDPARASKATNEVAPERGDRERASWLSRPVQGCSGAHEFDSATHQ